MTFVIDPKSSDQLIREDAARQALEAAALRLEKQAGGDTYMKAWAKAAKLIRELKPA